MVSALLSLYDDGEIEPSVARVAELAGVSERSVFRYFLDTDDLAATAIKIQTERVQHFYEGLSTTGAFDERLTALVEHRLRLFDAVRGVMRASIVREHRSDVVHSASDFRRNFLRKQAVEQFRAEIAGRDTVARAVEVALSLETLAYLESQHSRSAMRSTVETMVRAILGQD